ncbi:MAG: MFS family permease [Paracoccaceae bacterium]|jgi:MFS family permease
MIDVAALFVAYLVSQFYRSFLAVLAPALRADLGIDAATLSNAAGAWFLAFAFAQVPVGIWLDRYGPRRTSGWLLTVGAGGGGVLFAMADGPGMLIAAMALIGVGCAPILMAGMVIFARRYPPVRFATLSGAMIGFGSLGNVLGASPLAWAVEIWGWREVILGLSVVTAAIGLGLLAVIKDPTRIHAPGDNALRGLLEVLRLPALRFLIPLALFNYALSAGIRGSWAGPYLEDIYGMDAIGIGQATLWMALAMVAGNFIVGPLSNRFGTIKGVLLPMNGAGVGCTLALALSNPSAGTASILFALIGLCGASYALLMTHAKAYLPLHLTGRGVTLMNFFGIGGVGLGQIVTGRIHSFATAEFAEPGIAYDLVFGYYAVALTAALFIYAFSSDVRR